MATPAEELIEVRAAYRRACAQVAELDQVANDLRERNEVLLTRVETLESRLERLTRRVYGASSERHHPGQMTIDLGQPEGLDDANTTDSARPASVAPAESTEASGLPATDRTPHAGAGAAPAKGPVERTHHPRRPGSHPGRRRPPVGTEIIEEELTVPESERLDAQGQPLPVLGYRLSDKWDYRPGTYLIRRFRRAIYGRPFSVAQDRLVTDLPPMLIPRGAMTDAALVHTVVEKFADHLPLYRQVGRAGRSGFTLSRSTLVNQVAVVAQAMKPIVEVLGEQIRQAPYLHLDDTPVRLLDPGRGRTATARIWVYRSADATVFRFSTTREGRHPAEFLGEYRGYIVADAYAGHERLYGLEQATHVACWAHARRKFNDLKHRYPLALAVVEDLGALYAVESATRLASVSDRHRIRQDRSRPILSRIAARLDQALAHRLPASDLGEAIDYTRKRWPQLRRYLEQGWLPIDNNPAENALRPWALGRKNWLFLGSEAGGERAAILATIVENCRRQALDPHQYLCDTIAALHAGRTDYAALTPQAVARAQDATAAGVA